MNRLVGGLVTGLCLAVVPAASAATYHPNDTGDHAPNGCSSHDCTLREAITKANNHSGADTVVLEGGETYNLHRANAVSDEDANATGDLDVTDNLKIKSSNSHMATVDANHIDGVFEIGPGGAVNATFSDIKVTGGKDQTDAGGGIRARNGGVLTLVRSQVSGNQALDEDGGGISVGTNAEPGTLKITKSFITHNHTAEYAGGIEADNGAEHVSISKSTIANNSADGGYGGMVSESGGTLSIKRSSIVGNTASGYDGGGIYNGDSARIDRSTIDGNTTSDSGGGIANHGTLKLTNSTVSRNHADNATGGGIYTDSGTLRMTNDTVAKNTASDAGGIVYESSSTAAYLNAVTIAFNRAVGSGTGGTFVSSGAPDGSWHISNSIIAKNKAASNYPDCSDGPLVATSNGHNLYGDGTYCDATGGDRRDVNAKLGSFGDHGGPTATVSLRSGSPAINHAGNDAPARDQRGGRRHNPDIGAFER